MLDPMLEMQTMDISYKCPHCGKRQTIQVTFLSNTKKEIQYQKSHWCKDCNARHLLKYLVFYNRKKDLMFKMIEFLSNEERFFKKHFSVINTEKGNAS